MDFQESYTVASNPVIEQGGLVSVLFAGESQTKPGHRLGPKVYDFYLMHYVLSGKGIFVCEGQRHELRPGHTFLIEPERLVSYESDQSEPWMYRWIAFAGEQAAELAAAGGFTASEPVADTRSGRRAEVLYKNVFRSLREGGASPHLKAAGYLHLLFAEYGAARQERNGESVGNASGEGEKLLRQMIHYMSTQYTQPLSIEQMAESLGYNRAYLSRLFKQRTGVSPVTFLLKLRIDKARQMLRERGDLTIEQIAASVGLQDALYFSKQFKRFYRQSPTAYRKAMQNLQK